MATHANLTTMRNPRFAGQRAHVPVAAARDTQARWLAFALVLFVSTTPLSWIVVTNVGGINLQTFHFTGLFLCFVVMCGKDALADIRVILTRETIVWFSTLLLVLVSLLSFMKAIPPFAFNTVPSQIGYVTFSLFTGAAIYSVGRRLGIEILYWLPIGSAVTFFTILQVELARNGMTLFGPLYDALAVMNPDRFIFPVFLALFKSGALVEGNAHANLRHTMAFALVLIAAITWLIPAREQGPHPLRRPAQLASTALLGMGVLSMSRSTWLMVAMSGLIVTYVYLLRGKSLSRYIVVSGGAAIGLLAVVASPIGQLLIARLDSTSSYSARAHATQTNFNLIARYPWTGSPFGEPMEWSHNLLADFWLAIGLPGFIAAALFTLAIYGSILKWMNLACKQNHFVSSVYAYAACMYTVPAARIVTAPRGDFDIAPWIALGMALGFVSLIRRPASVR